MVRHLKNTCAKSISLLKCNLKTLERQNYPAKYFFVSFEVQLLIELNITQLIVLAIAVILRLAIDGHLR